jgi:hypothetical protein
MRLVFAALLLLCLLPLSAQADQEWLVASDLHVNPFDSRPDPSGYTVDTNWVLFENSLAEMRRTVPNPAVVVIAGDFLAHSFDAKVHQFAPGETVNGAAQSTMSRIVREFGRAFPHAQFLITLGNNDDPCGDYRTAPNSAYLQRVAQIWEPLVNRGGAAPDFARDFSHGGYYTVNLRGSHSRAVVLDDVFWSFLYRSCGSGAPPPRQLTWLNHTLTQTPGGTRNIVLMHIPPGADAAGTLIAHRFFIVPFLRPNDDSALTSAFAKHRASIAFAVVGHTHRSTFRLVGGVPVLVAPAISPIYKNNPAFLRLLVESSGTLRDYTQFADDLYGDGWFPQFDFAKTYGVSPFDAHSLQVAQQRIGANPDIRAVWIDSLMAGAPDTSEIRWAWRSYWCAQEFTAARYASCAGDQRRVVLLPLVLLAIAALVVAAFVWIVVRLASQRSRT